MKEPKPGPTPIPAKPDRTAIRVVAYAILAIMLDLPASLLAAQMADSRIAALMRQISPGLLENERTASLPILALTLAIIAYVHIRFQRRNHRTPTDQKGQK